MRYWVYIHTCPNGKKYVGVTTQEPEARWRGGQGYIRQSFYRAILKHGWDNIQHEVFEVGSKEEMYRKEIELISFYHSNDPRYGYNHSEGGEKGTRGCSWTEESRTKLSESRKRVQKLKWKDPEYRTKMSEAHKGKPSPKKGKPQPQVRVTFSLQDGTVKEMSIQNMKKHYLNKGIKITILD